MNKKRLTTVVWGVVTAAIILTMVISGLRCSSPPAPTATPAPAPKPTAAAASTSAPAAAPTATTAPAKPTAAPAPAKVYKTRLTTHWTEKHPMGQWLLAFASDVKTKTNGQLQIEVFFNQVLYKNADTVPAVGAGNLEFAAMSFVWWVGLSPEFAATDMPYLLSGTDAAQKLYQSPGGKALLARTEQKNGIKILADWPAGDQYWFSRSKPLKTLEDFKGITIRSRGGAWGDAIKGLDSKSIVVGVTETYTALQQGMFEAVPLSTMAPKSFGWDPFLKYMTAPATVPDTPGGLIINGKFFDSLPPDVQKAVSDLSAQYSKKNYEEIAAESAAALKGLQAGGMTVVNMDPAELAKIKTKLYTEIYATLFDKWDAAFKADLAKLTQQ